MPKRPNPAKIRRRSSEAIRAKREFDDARAAERSEADGEAEEKTDPLTEEKLLLFQRARETRKGLLEYAGVEDLPPLMAAVASGDPDEVQRALAGSGSLEERVEVDTKEGPVELGPMDVAIDLGSPGLVRALLEAGVDVNDHWLFPTWLHAYVSLYPAATALTYQLDAGTKGTKGTKVGQRAQLFKRHPEFVKVTRVLVDAGADPNAYDEYEETTAAEKAAKYQIQELEDLFGEPADQPESAR